MSDDEAVKIAKLNDQLRTTFRGGTVCMTAGINALSDEARVSVFQCVQQFKEFTPDNDPYGEHDCGLLEAAGVRVIWKIDYYDPTFSVHSDDPTDASVTGRVLTIMLAEEN